MALYGPFLYIALWTASDHFNFPLSFFKYSFLCSFFNKINPIPRSPANGPSTAKTPSG